MALSLLLPPSPTAGGLSGRRGGSSVIMRALVLAWLSLAAAKAATPEEGGSHSELEQEAKTVPPSFDSPFGSYPNLLNITEEDRASFYPLVVFPRSVRGSVTVKDHRRSSGELASGEEIAMRRLERLRAHQRALPLRLLHQAFAGGLALVRRVSSAARGFLLGTRGGRTSSSSAWGIGKYDENRDGGMYESDLFDDLDHRIDGFGGRRTVHLGLDLGGPVGTPVHAFSDAVVHSVGYNPERGDYGHAVVLQHFWGEGTGPNGTATPKTCWALYGHLDRSVLGGGRRRWPWKSRQRKRLSPGDPVARGQVLGRMGDIDENGGWIHAHLHFQLSDQPPETDHDMPGASSVPDRGEALLRYPDPRYVVGPIYGGSEASEAPPPS